MFFSCNSVITEVSLLRCHLGFVNPHGFPSKKDA
jgi:hypothetical protein